MVWFGFRGLIVIFFYIFFIYPKILEYCEEKNKKFDKNYREKQIWSYNNYKLYINELKESIF